MPQDVARMASPHDLARALIVLFHELRYLRRALECQTLGAALVAMVGTLSEGRPKYAQHADLHAWAGETGNRLADQFLALVRPV